jgi:hypothetical protein
MRFGRTRRPRLAVGILFVAVTSSIALATTPVQAARGHSSALAAARAELNRVQIRLVRAAEVDPAVIEARDASRRACAALYQVRQNVLAAVRATPEYADLRLALWAKQRQISGLHEEVPTQVQSLATNARDAMELRSKLTAMEQAALDADATYVEAREDANQALAAHLQAQRDAIAAVRNNGEYVAALTRVQSMQRAITGYGLASAR